MNTKAFLQNDWFVRILTVTIILIIWQIVGQSVNPIIWATPLETAHRFAELWSDGTLPSSIAITIQTVLVGFAVSATAGIPIGFAMGRSRVVEYSLDPYVNFIYAIPIVIMIPLLLIWVGSNLTASYVEVIIASIFPVIINVMAGVKNVPRSLIETGRSFGFSRSSLWRKIILPASVPYVMAGLRIGVASSMVGAVLAQLFLFPVGLGYIIDLSSTRFDTPAVIAGVLVTMAVAIALTEAVGLIEKRLCSWATGLVGIS